MYQWILMMIEEHLLDQRVQESKLKPISRLMFSKKELKLNHRKNENFLTMKN